MSRLSAIWSMTCRRNRLKFPSNDKMTPRHLIVWDLETIPDLAAAARIHGAEEANEGQAREVLGDKFPKLPLHKIICIGALIAEWQVHSWQVRSLGAPHIGERSESELIASFVEKIAELRPQLVTYNGNSFDLPVLRYRAMVNRVSAPGLHARDYFRRYTDDAIDLCDVLSSFDARSKVSLNDLCRVVRHRDRDRDLAASYFHCDAVLIALGSLSRRNHLALARSGLALGGAWCLWRVVRVRARVRR